MFASEDIRYKPNYSDSSSDDERFIPNPKLGRRGYRPTKKMLERRNMRSTYRQNIYSYIPNINKRSTKPYINKLTHERDFAKFMIMLRRKNKLLNCIEKCEESKTSDASLSNMVLKKIETCEKLGQVKVYFERLKSSSQSVIIAENRIRMNSPVILFAEWIIKKDSTTFGRSKAQLMSDLIRQVTFKNKITVDDPKVNDHISEPITGTLLNIRDNIVCIGTKPNKQFRQFLFKENKTFEIQESANNVEVKRQKRSLQMIKEAFEGKCHLPGTKLVLDLLHPTDKDRIYEYDFDADYADKSSENYRPQVEHPLDTHNGFEKFFKEQCEKSEIFKLVAGCNEVEELSPMDDLKKNKMNESQKRAVAHCLYDKYPLSIIHGPPGTGKTKTIATTILLLMLEGKRILVTAQSNNATDTLLKEVDKQFYIIKKTIQERSRIENSATGKHNSSLTSSEDESIYSGDFYGDTFERNSKDSHSIFYGGDLKDKDQMSIFSSDVGSKGGETAGTSTMVSTIAGELRG